MDVSCNAVDIAVSATNADKADGGNGLVRTDGAGALRFVGIEENLRRPRFATLYDRHGDAVFRLCLRLCGGCHAEAEDLCQEVLIAAFHALPRFAGRARLTTYLYTIAVRTFRKRRTRQEPATLPLRDDQMSASAMVDNSADVYLTRLTIQSAIAALPDPLREAFVLVKSEGRTHREAAALLSLPQGTVQARVHEAARRLRVALSVEE